jgi:NodT family efflux transporter outer membrane factor (OMF) lipoprotein
MNGIFRAIATKGLAGLLLSSGLAACSVGPDYVAPQNTLAPFHNFATVSVAQGQPSPPLDQWWTGFNDPMLVTVVRRALSQNLQLDAALARVREARAAASGSSAQLLPTVDLGASTTFEHQSLNGAFGSVANGSPGFHQDDREDVVGPSASWEIDLFGGLGRQAKAAREEAQAAQAEQAGTRITVAADAADAYLQIRGYQARLAVAQNQIDVDEHLVDLVNSRFSNGAATDREVAQAEALLKQARATVPPLRLALEMQFNRLDVLMGAQPGTYAEEIGTLVTIPSVPAIPGNQNPVDVLRRRPDIIAAERRLAASNEEIGAAISDYYPKISLSGLLGFDSLNTSSLFTGNSFEAAGSGALRWRLFDFGKVDAEVAQAKGANAEALAAYRQAVLKAAEDVEDSLAGLAQTQAHLAELQDEAQSLIKARDLAVEAYRNGSITLTDVLDADSQLLTVQDQIDADKADAARAAVGVFRALGGGWDPQDQPAVRDADTGKIKKGFGNVGSDG